MSKGQRSEFTANAGLSNFADETARWQKVLAPTLPRPARVPTKSIKLAQSQFSIPLPALVIGALCAVWAGVAVALYLFY